MAKCINCGEKFKKKEAREEYNLYFQDEGFDYKEEFPDDELCGSCAIDVTLGYMSTGAAVLYEADEDTPKWSYDE